MKLIPQINLIKLKEGLTKTRENFLNKISETITRKATIDEQTISDIEETLISCDLGFDLTEKLIDNARKKILSNPHRSNEFLIQVIKEELSSLLLPQDFNLVDQIKNSPKPYVILVVGINGSGKTTTIGKIAYLLKLSDLKVIIGSGDTFRAAANDQLKVWAEKAQVEFLDAISKDSASIAYTTVRKALEDKMDVVLIDTAGRLHNNKNLMNELSKIKKVISSLIPGSPNDVFLVVDGNSGQNALMQVNEFNNFIELTGLIITKLDGTAKGGIIFQLCYSRKIPIRFVGVGEGIDTLQNFSTEKYIDALFPSFKS